MMTVTLCENAPEWLVDAYRVTTVLTVFLIAFVKQKAEHDLNLMKDHHRLQFFRGAGFILTGWSVVVSFIWPSIISLMLVYLCGVVNLSIDALALHIRSKKPPKNPGSEEVVWGTSGLSPQMGHYISKSDVDRLDRGQLYTINLLENILRNQELRPDSVVVPIRKQQS